MKRNASTAACAVQCPHGVFAKGEKRAVLKKPEACMECGVCQFNCPTGAVTVGSSAGCASAPACC